MINQYGAKFTLTFTQLNLRLSLSIPPSSDWDARCITGKDSFKLYAPRLSVVLFRTPYPFVGLRPLCARSLADVRRGILFRASCFLPLASFIIPYASLATDVLLRQYPAKCVYSVTSSLPQSAACPGVLFSCEDF